MARTGQKNASPLPIRTLRRVLCRLHRLWRGPEEAMSGEVTIAGGSWRVEIAMTAHRRYVGLGGRSELAEGTGMLFIYPDAGIREFSMRDCRIPLDIAFLSPSLEVVSVFTMAVEPDRAGRRSYVPGKPAQYILETPADELVRAGVVCGSKARLSAGVPAAIWSEPAPQT